MKAYYLYINNVNGYSGWLSSSVGAINLRGGFITPVISAHKNDAIPLDENDVQNIVKCLDHYGIASDVFEVN